MCYDFQVFPRIETYVSWIRVVIILYTPTIIKGFIMGDMNHNLYIFTIYIEGSYKGGAAHINQLDVCYCMNCKLANSLLSPYRNLSGSNNIFLFMTLETLKLKY